MSCLEMYRDARDSFLLSWVGKIDLLLVSWSLNSIDSRALLFSPTRFRVLCPFPGFSARSCLCLSSSGHFSGSAQLYQHPTSLLSFFLSYHCQFERASLLNAASKYGAQILLQDIVQFPAPSITEFGAPPPKVPLTKTTRTAA